MDKPLKVLAVDDEFVNRELFRIIIADDAYNVLITESGAEAIEIIKREKVDLLVTDYMMPEMNGIDLAIAAKELNPDIKSILVTAVTDRELIIDALKAGMNDYIPKPFTPEDLMLSINRVSAEISHEKNLKEQQAQISLYYKAMEQCSASIMITDAKGNVEYVNPYFTMLTGYTSDEIIGKNPRVLRDSSEETLDFSLWDYVREHDEWRGEFKNIKKSGEPCWESACISSVRNDDNEVTNFIVIKEDITERKKMQASLESYQNNLEDLVTKRAKELAETNKRLVEEMQEREKLEALRQQEQINAMNQNKLASLGEIATGVAHEINQPLTYINTVLQVNLEKLKSGKVDPEKLMVKFERALHQTSRITSIITHLRAFGRADDDVMIPLNLVEILDNSLILLSEKMRLNSITLKRDIEDNLPAVVGNSIKLEQLFINFFQNSIDALSGKDDGNITVGMKSDAERGQVILTFHDDGEGIPAEVQEKIFQPFFTTKEVGKGTGLGLAIIIGIIQDHKGTIECDSQVGKGTTFTLTFPFVSE